MEKELLELGLTSLFQVFGGSAVSIGFVGWIIWTQVTKSIKKETKLLHSLEEKMMGTTEKEGMITKVKNIERKGTLCEGQCKDFMDSGKLYDTFVKKDDYNKYQAMHEERYKDLIRNMGESLQNINLKVDGLYQILMEHFMKSKE